MAQRRPVSGIPARAAALAILMEILRKRRQLDNAADSRLTLANLDSRDAGFARAIVRETLRRLGQLQALVQTFVPKLPPQHRAGPTLEILLAGACEILFLNTASHAAVDAANELATADSKAVHFRPLINAVLRRVAREGDAIIAAQDAPRLNTPDWLWSRWDENYGEDIARGIGAAHLAPPPLDIHPKSAGAFLPDGEALPGGLLRLRESGRIEEIPGYAEGHWWVQDFAATLPVRMLGDVCGKEVIDLCAAPGGKSAQLSAIGAKVVAVERDAERMQRLRENLVRLNLPAQLVEADLRDFSPDERVPFVLLDAPCSATGTIRRHPDLPWIKSAADIDTCANVTPELLESAADMLADGGRLVFSVCSLEPEEGRELIDAFLARRNDFHRLAVQPGEIFGMGELIRDGDLRTLPCHLSEQGGMDGFYATRLQRSGG